LKANRLVSVQGNRKNRPVSEWYIPPRGRVMHLKGYGWVKVFKTVTPDGREEYWATSRLDMTIDEAAEYALHAWQIEVYHQGLKQFTGIERGQFRVAVAQQNHIALAIRAFLRLEIARLQRGITWFEAKHSIIREAIRYYLAHPTLVLQPTATNRTRATKDNMVKPLRTFMACPLLEDGRLKIENAEDRTVKRRTAYRVSTLEFSISIGVTQLVEGQE